MSQYTVENDENLTTDAVPDAPRENVNQEPLIIEEEPDKSETETNTESDQNIKSSLSYPINNKKKSPTSNTTNSKPRKKSANGSAKTTHASTKVINVLNSSGVHIGAVNNYNLFNAQNKQKNNNQQKENIVRTASVDRIIASEELLKPEHISFVSTHLGEGWREVGDILGYSKGQLDHFYFDHKNVGLKEVVYKMLLDWTQVKPDDSKIGTLAAALWDADQKDVVCRWSKNY